MMMTATRTNYSISMVIPAYNEEANIRDVVLESLNVLQSLTECYEVIVMDDASWDHTGMILDELVIQYPDNVRVIHHQVNRGTNLSLVELFRNAKYDLVFFLPADKQILPKAIHQYLPLVEKEGADVVLGWRAKRADPFYRGLFNWLYRFILRVFLGLHYRDAAASDLYKKSVLDQIEMESQGRLLQAEIATKASYLGYKICEVPVEHFPRVAGKQTGINSKTAWLSFVDILRLGIKIRGLKTPKKNSSLHPLENKHSQLHTGSSSR
jgi:glycosyltransferase involved in cell wall biosynthesis